MEFDEDENEADDAMRNAALDNRNSNGDVVVDKSQAGGENISIPPVMIGEDGRVRSRAGTAAISEDDEDDAAVDDTPVGALEVDEKMQVAVVGLEDEDQIMMYRWCICAMVFGWVTLI